MRLAANEPGCHTKSVNCSSTFTDCFCPILILITFPHITISTKGCQDKNDINNLLPDINITPLADNIADKDKPYCNES